MILARTPRLELLVPDRPLVEALLRDRAEATRLLGAAIPADWPVFPEGLLYAREALRARAARGDTTLDPWGALFFVDRHRDSLVGSGGFKGLPDERGDVELGYEISPTFQRLGYATEAAEGMMRHAFTQPGVRTVSAQTLPEKNFSTRVLEKIGMLFEGAAVDPGHGEVWVWRIRE